LFTFLVGRQASAVSLPPDDVFWAQQACTLNDVIFTSTSRITNRSLNKHGCLPKLKEIVVPVATASKCHYMLYQIKIKTKKFLWHTHLLSLNIDTHGSNLSSDFQKIHFLTKLAN
jgi:hypothetical protein